MGRVPGDAPALANDGRLAYAKNGERPGRRLGTVAATSSTVIGTLATGVMAWGLRRHPLAVGPGGLRSCDTRGKPVSLPWDMPAAVRPGRAGLMPDLRVDAPGLARPVVVPLRVADPHGFCDAVCEFAGPDHPLTAALRDRLADEGG